LYPTAWKKVRHKVILIKSRLSGSLLRQHSRLKLYKMRTLVMGDIHGAHKALRQCLKKAAFDKEKDVLIQLGDIADGYNDEVDECVSELLTIRNLIALKGNHDEWFNQFILTGYHPDAWIQGGASTARSYLRRLGKEKMILRTSNGYKTALNPGDIPEEHRLFFHRQRLYHIDEWNNCYVHGGFDRGMPFKGQRPEVYYWDREETDKPMHAANIINLDPGAGASGRLTIMDVKSKKFWQSDPVHMLYSSGSTLAVPD
jgi:serine/threonine protein phosphatase 1